MVKGSTPTFTLKLPVHSDIITDIQVIFVQEKSFHSLSRLTELLLTGISRHSPSRIGKRLNLPRGS